MKEHTKEIVAEIKGNDKKYKHDNISTKPCPDCGKLMLEVNGKKAKCLYVKIVNVDIKKCITYHKRTLSEM